MVKPDEVIHATVAELSKQKSIPFMTVADYIANKAKYLAFYNNRPIMKIELCKVPCMTPKYTLTFMDNTATIVNAGTKLYARPET